MAGYTYYLIILGTESSDRPKTEYCEDVFWAFKFGENVGGDPNANLERREGEGMERRD